MSFTTGSVAKSLAEVEARLANLNALERVKIIAVTKGFDTGAIDAAIASGLTRIGENYAQEAASKHEATQAFKAEWHFIGQLQRNKVKLLAPFINVWQTVDNAGLIAEIAKRAPNASVLIQVNLTDDSGRGGCEWSELDGLVTAARSAGLHVLGLMGVAPQVDECLVRACFGRLVGEAARLELAEVSMGMSGDFEVAVEEGATMIRLGSTLFGPRPLPGREPR